MLSYLNQHKTSCPIDILYGRSWETGVDNLAVIGEDLATVDLSFVSSIGGQRFNKHIDKSGLSFLKFRIARGFYKLSENLEKNFQYYKKVFFDRKVEKDFMF